ncbi:MAG: winged helix-turn-helix domain-containing protein, partial [Aestuariivita sp.]
KRTYGYYVFPLLEKDRLIGRIDMKAYRDRDVLIVRRVWPEQTIRWSDARTRRVEAELQRVARLAGVSEVRFEKDWLNPPA